MLSPRWYFQCTRGILDFATSVIHDGTPHLRLLVAGAIFHIAMCKRYCLLLESMNLEEYSRYSISKYEQSNCATDPCGYSILTELYVAGTDRPLQCAV